MDSVHIPVMLDEVIEYLDLKPGDRFLDCTLGAAGHSSSIGKVLGMEGTLVGVDQDDEILEIARKNLEDFEGRLHFCRMNFEHIDKVPEQTGVEGFEGILFDLGVSSLQLDTPERGFSFQSDAPLDMRMDKRSDVTAATIINSWPEQDLADMFREYGQEYAGAKIASWIVQDRVKKPFESTLELAGLIKRAKRAKGHQRINPATKAFQALRIAVNRELDVLPRALEKAVDLLAPSGRIAVISFHSLEDRMVKRFFKQHKDLKVLTKKIVAASFEESRQNKRARSAKLRVAQKQMEE